MAKTILPKKSSDYYQTSDEHQESLTSDPYFPQEAHYGFYDYNIQGSQTPILTSAAAVNAASGAEVLVPHDKESYDFINKKWRPLMAFVYMITCTVDFIIFPILWSLLQTLSNGSVTTQWQPLTLQGAGLYHIAMGAVLGIAAYGRSREKIEGVAS